MIYQLVSPLKSRIVILKKIYSKFSLASWNNKITDLHEKLDLGPTYPLLVI